MLEIRFHGRGGQGAVVASELLAQAAFLDGKRPQSFPFFGVERRGAPVTAYCRIDDREVRLRTSITRPDIVVVLEPGLLRAGSAMEGLKPDGILLVNSREEPAALPAPADVRRASVDATTIALTHGLGTPMMPIVNTAILGALAAASGAVSLGALEQAIDRFVPAHPAENRAAARDGAAAVRVAPPLTAGHSRGASSAVARAPPLELPDAPMAVASSATIATAAWRTLRPEIDQRRCTRCNFCWKFCPDVAIELNAEGFPVVHLEHCKGCGICAAECPPGAIAMVAEG